MIYSYHMKPQLLTKFILLVTNTIEALLGLRIILKLLGAAPEAPFVAWIYNTTSPLLYPFRNMFPESNLANSFNLEFSSIFALIIYSFISYLIIHMINLTSKTTHKN